MIDFTWFRVPFVENACLVVNDGELVRLREDVLKVLKTKKTTYEDEDGNVTNVTIPWHSVQSGQSTLAYKVFNPCVKGVACVEFKCSPAKLKDGHNVFGSDDLIESIDYVISQFKVNNPELSFCLDWKLAELILFDVTYHSFADNHYEAEAFIQALKSVSNGQIKVATGKNSATQKLSVHQSTVYWNPQSSHCVLKAYLKWDELISRREDILYNLEEYAKFNKAHPPELIDYCLGMVRWEARIKAKKMKSLGIPTLITRLKTFVAETNFDPKEVWQRAFKSVFEALRADSMEFTHLPDIELKDKFIQLSRTPKTIKKKILIVDNDDKQYTKMLFADWKELERTELSPTVVQVQMGREYISDALGLKCWETYQDIRNLGFANTKEKMKRRTFYDHISFIVNRVGISKAVLQQFEGTDRKPKVLPFIKFATVNFEAQTPLYAIQGNK